MKLLKGVPSILGRCALPSPPSAQGRLQDEGSALIETVVVIFVVLVPMVWIAVAVTRVEQGAFAARHAAREAARTFVTAPSSEQGRARADVAALVAHEDHGVPAGHTALTCSASPCLTPGGTVTATTATTIPLPFVPRWLADGAHLEITVRASQHETVERYGGQR